MFALSVASAALAGLLFGFDTAVIAGVVGDIRELFDLSPAALGFTVSSALWGTLAGALVAGGVGHRYGSRDALRITALLYLVSALGCAFAQTWEALVVFRVIGGLAIGASSVLAPVYLAEISPPHRRGMLVGMFQLNIVLGILAAYLSNYIVGSLELGAAQWRWKFAVMAAPAILLALTLLYVPASPRWLALKGRLEDALQALRQLGAADPHAELHSMRKAPTVAEPAVSWSRYRKPAALAITIAVFNQLTGINAILYYLNDIFAAAGFSSVSSDIQAVVVGATNFVFTAVAMFCIDSLGRRRLLLIGAAGMTVCLALVATIMSGAAPRSYLLWALVAFIAFFAFSQGAVIWVYLSEIFPTALRSQGQALGSSTHWLLNALLALFFPIVAARSQSAPFVFFAGMMLLQVVVVWRWFPETRGTPLEGVQIAAAGEQPAAQRG